MLSFLLKEYEKIADSFFDAREVTSKWVKYYLLVIAVPFSFIPFIYKDNPGNFNLFSLPNTIALLFSFIGIIGLFLACIIIHSGMNSILYARAVNGIRKYYIDRAKKHNCNLRPYIVLPYDVNVPKYFNWGGELFMIVLTCGLINSIYLGLGFSQITFVQEIYKSPFNQSKFAWTIVILSIIVHVIIYIGSAIKKERTYGPKV